MSCLFPVFVKNVGNVPCNRCPKCLETRVDHWVFRMMQEERRSVSSAFLTLTYADGMADVTPNNFLTLSKRHVQLFFKRLRKALPKQHPSVKYYVAGEYGGDTQRPHYHVIVFNIPREWLLQQTLYRFWSDDEGVSRGNIDYGQVFDSTAIGYTVGYCTKQRIVGWHKNDDRMKEFSLMSKKMGDNYITPSTLRYHQRDFLNRSFLSLPGGKLTSMPRYYKDRIYSAGQRLLLAQQVQLRQWEPNDDELSYMARHQATWAQSSSAVWHARAVYTNNYFKQKKQRRQL